MPKQTNKQSLSRGQLGEQLAANFLVHNLHHHILARNYACKLGEIDVISIERDTIHFVEVKTRTNKQFGPLHTAVTPWKLKRLTKACQTYIQKSLPRSANCLYQLDLITVDLSQKKRAHIQYFPQIHQK